MNRPDTDRLYNLLPAIYRLRDADQGEPLRALLRVISEQVNVVEADIDQLYTNWFIETCQDWVTPYLGDLIGYQPIHEAGEPNQAATAEGQLRNRIVFPRCDVANTTAARRRKGTLALLEQLANDVAGWPARAVEFYALLGLTQPLNHLRLGRGRTADLRRGDALDRLDGPFDELAHTVSVAGINSTRTQRRYNIPSIGLFVWRLQPFSITRAPAFCVDRFPNHYTFSILGNDTPLLTNPVVEPDPAYSAGDLNVPDWIRRRPFDDRTADYYGPAKSLYIWRDGLDQPVPLAQIVAADLSAWRYVPQRDQVAVDPVRGRIAFPPRQAPEGGVWVSYYYGFSAPLGGGEYDRPLSPAGTRIVYRVGPDEQDQTIMAAVQRWRADRQAGNAADALIEITDSGVYQEPIELTLAAGERLELRAAQRTRPVIRLLDWYSNRPDALRIRALPAPADGPAAPPPRLTLDGLLVAGRSVQAAGPLGRLTIRHCTLAPGWSLEHDCEPQQGEEPSLELTDSAGPLIVEHSILGSILVNEDEVATDPLAITLTDSLLDATDTDLVALSGEDGRYAHAALTIQRVTVIGRVLTHAIELAENTIFTGRARVVRRQEGCVRFCYLPAGSRTPRRYHCQPDLVVAAVADAVARGDLAAAEQPGADERERRRVRPQFNSTRYGTPAYGQLAAWCAPEIARGADDEAELGVFHDLFQPQRAANLRARLDEYTPAGMDAGIVFVS
ncbi:MAG: hypothetical protein ACTHMP_08170 [Thermomicrobiales bacterium]